MYKSSSEGILSSLWIIIGIADKFLIRGVETFLSTFVRKIYSPLSVLKKFY